MGKFTLPSQANVPALDVLPIPESYLPSESIYNAPGVDMASMLDITPEQYEAMDDYEKQQYEEAMAQSRASIEEAQRRRIEEEPRVAPTVTPPTEEAIDPVTAAMSRLNPEEVAQEYRRRLPVEAQVEGENIRPQMVNTEGEVMTPEQQTVAMAQEQVIQGKNLPIKDNVYDYTQGIFAGDPSGKMDKDTRERYMLKSAAKRLRGTLGKINFKPVNSYIAAAAIAKVPESVSAIQYLKEQADVARDADIMNAIFEETLAMSAEVVRDPEAKRAFAEELQEEPPSEMSEESLLNRYAGTEEQQLASYKEVMPDDYYKPMPVEAFQSRLGTKIKRNLANKRAVNGYVDKSNLSGLNNSTIGNLVMQGLLEDGYLTLIDDGKAVVLTETGNNVYRASKRETSIRQQMSDISGDVSTTPAPYDRKNLSLHHKGEPISPFRGKRFKRYTSRNRPFNKLPEVYRAQTIVGRSAHTTNKTKASNVALILALGTAPNVPSEIKDFANDLLNVGKARYEKLSKDSNLNEIEIVQDIQSIATQIIRTSKLFVDSMVSGIPFYDRQDHDPMSGRGYSESYYGGWQGNPIARAFDSNAKVHKSMMVFDSSATGKNNLDAALNALETKKDNPAQLNRLAAKAAENMLTNPDNPTPDTELIFRLAYSQALLTGDMDTEKQTFESIFKLVDLDRLKEIAGHGRAIRKMWRDIGTIGPDGKFNPEVYSKLMYRTELDGNRNPTYRAIVQRDLETKELFIVNQGSPVNLTSLNDNNSPEFKAIQFLKSIPGIDYKNFGTALSLIEDVTSFVDDVYSKKKADGTIKATWMPTSTPSMDMHMAGGTAYAASLGDQLTVMRSGINWELMDNEKDLADGHSRIDENRVAFTKEAADVLKNPRAMASIFESPKADYDMMVYADAWINALSTRLLDPSDNVTFAKALAKAPVLTTIYGRPAMSHFDSMLSFLQSGKSKDIVSTMNKYYNNDIYNMAIDLASIVEQTLYKQTARDFARFQKESTNYLGLFGITPRFEGFFGNDWEMGVETLVDDELQGHFIGPDGSTIPLSTVKSELDMGARKNPSDIKVYEYDEKKGKNVLKTKPHIPNRYSMVSNSIQPIYGQGAESEAQVHLHNTGNKTEAMLADPLFTGNVFDNTFSDWHGIIRYAAHANRYGGPVDEVFNYNRAEKFVEGYRERAREILEGFDTLVKARGGKDKATIDIGLKGEFTGILHQGDNVYDNINKMKEEGTWDKPDTQYWTRYYKQLKDIFDAMGYVPDDGRNRDNVAVPASNFYKKIPIIQFNNLMNHKPKAVSDSVMFAYSTFFRLDEIAQKAKGLAGNIGTYQRARNNMLQEKKDAEGKLIQMIFYTISL